MRSIVIGACACVLIGACASSKGASPPSSPPDTASTSTTVAATTTTAKRPAPVDYKAKYLKLVGPYNTAIAALNASDPNRFVPAPLVAVTTQALQDFDTATLRVHWPGPTTNADVRTMVLTDAAVIVDLAQVNNQTTASVAAFNAQYAKDSQAGVAAANIVRSDLGLPPPPA